jgi:hypothetical protein
VNQPEVNQVLTGLGSILDTVPRRLAQITDADAAQKASPDRWSKKEILGHLIDSAGNNHQRFVRAQLALHIDFPPYEQESWVGAQSYGNESWTDLVNLWVAFNRHILHLLKAMPESALPHEISIGGKPPMTLVALSEDYVRHLNHHLDQIFGT